MLNPSGPAGAGWCAGLAPKRAPGPDHRPPSEQAQAAPKGAECPELADPDCPARFSVVVLLLALATFVFPGGSGAQVVAPGCWPAAPQGFMAAMGRQWPLAFRGGAGTPFFTGASNWRLPLLVVACPCALGPGLRPTRHQTGELGLAARPGLLFPARLAMRSR